MKPCRYCWNPPWAKPVPKSLYWPKRRKNRDVAIRTTAMVLGRAAGYSGIGSCILREGQLPARRTSPGCSSATRPVIGDVLLQGIEFLTEIPDAPLEHVADGKHPQEPAIVVNHRQVTEVPFDHDGQGLTRSHRRNRQLHRRGHHFPYRRFFRILPAQRQLAQNIPFGEDAGYSLLAVDHRYRSHAPFEHGADRIRHTGFRRYCCRYRITEFQDSHNDPL